MSTASACWRHVSTFWAIFDALPRQSALRGKMKTMSTAATRRDDILLALRSARPLLDSFGVAHLSLFGSFARDEAREDSDVDLLVDFVRPIGMFDFVRLQRELGLQVGRPVELVTRAALKPQLRDRILAELVIAA
jgi:predicted nucleotidyltransferase